MENACRWLTVMASGHEVHMDDLPPEMHAEQTVPEGTTGDWQTAMEQWAKRFLLSGQEGLMTQAVPEIERRMIEVALHHTGGKRQEAARLLGWGRNTLTRKIKELGMAAGGDADDDV